MSDRMTDDGAYTGPITLSGEQVFEIRLWTLHATVTIRKRLKERADQGLETALLKLLDAMAPLVDPDSPESMGL
jgi:hypothetical protein